MTNGSYHDLLPPQAIDDAIVTDYELANRGIFVLRNNATKLREFAKAFRSI